PGATQTHTLSLHDALPISAARLGTSLGLAAHSTSGWRRKVPVAEQGASSSTASKLRVVFHSAPSAVTISAASPVRARFSDSRLRDRKSTRLNSSHDQSSYA